MKTIGFLFVAFLVSTAAIAQQASDPNQDPTALGNAFFKSMLDEDGTTMGKLLAPDCTIISFDGSSVDGGLLLQGISGGVVLVETATVSNTQTRQYNSDAAVMTGSWKAKGSVQGQGFDNTVAFTVVAAKQGGSWKIVNVQFTPTR